METNRSCLRAVLDTNVPIGALISRNPNSPLVELLDRWLAGEFEILYSEDISAEYEEQELSLAVE